MIDLGPLMREQAALAATLIDGARSTVEALARRRPAGGLVHRLHARHDAAGARGGGRPGLRPGASGVLRRDPAGSSVAADDLQDLCGTRRLAAVAGDQGPTTPEAGVAEGRAAGCFTVGVAASGNGVGLVRRGAGGTAGGGARRPHRALCQGAVCRRRGPGGRQRRRFVDRPGTQGVTDMTQPVLLTPRAAQYLGRDQGRDARRLGLVGQRLQHADCRGVPRPHGHRPRRGGSMCGVPLQGSGTFCGGGGAGARWCRAAARCWSRTTAATASAWCGSSAVWAAPSWCCRMTNRRPPTWTASMRLLQADPGITHVAQVHCETGTGILNPLPQIAQLVERHGRRLIVDAMSSYAAIPLDARTLRFDALIAGVGQVPGGRAGHGLRDRAAREALAAAAGNSHFAGHGSSRPVAVHAKDRPMALHAAHPCGRRAACRPRSIPGLWGAAGAAFALHRKLCGAGVGHAGAGLRDLPAGCAAGADHRLTFHSPPDPKYVFAEFYARVRERGFILYPGKLTEVDTFRVGCIGAIGPDTLRAAVAAIGAGPAGDGSDETGACVRRRGDSAAGGVRIAPGHARTGSRQAWGAIS